MILYQVRQYEYHFELPVISSGLCSTNIFHQVCLHSYLYLAARLFSRELIWKKEYLSDESLTQLYLMATTGAVRSAVRIMLLEFYHWKHSTVQSAQYRTESSHWL